MTQSTNLKLDLLSATDLFDTDKIKSNFEKIDNTVLIPTKIIDNCVTDNSLLPLSAKQGKLLQDQITKLNGDLTNALNKKTQFDDLITRKVPIVSKNTMFAAGEIKEIYINSSYDGYTRIGVAGYNLASYDFIIGSIVDSSIAVKNNSETEKVLNKDSYVSVLYVKNR